MPVLNCTLVSVHYMRSRRSGNAKGILVVSQWSIATVPALEQTQTLILAMMSSALSFLLEDMRGYLYTLPACFNHSNAVLIDLGDTRAVSRPVMMNLQVCNIPPCPSGGSRS